VIRRAHVAATTVAFALSAPAPARAASAPGTDAPGLRSRFGLDVAARLMRSADADERVRGIDRASAIHTPEALALLVRAAGPTLTCGPEARQAVDGVARCDPRALLAVVRGLAAWPGASSARQALVSILEAPAQAFAARALPAPAVDPAFDDSGPSRVVLARKEAAIALARSGNSLALESLLKVARSGETGQEAAIEALDVVPPSGAALLGGVALTTRSTVALAARLGDLRTLDAILGIVGASDAGLRAEAIDALSAAGDTRVLAVARTSLHDSDARVRIAAAGALVRLGARDAGEAVEAVVADKETAPEALALAGIVQSEGVTRAVAALAAASADPALRSSALAALGHQTTPLAVRALLALAADPALEGDAACAIARSPSAFAGVAIEEIAVRSARLAARAYLVRRFTRGERIAPLDALVARLATSGDGRDRAVGVEALVTFGELPLERALEDADPRVRRAGAAAALAHRGGPDMALLRARIATEPDETTRRVLAMGLVDGDPEASVPTSALADRAQSGGPDAPLAALVVAQRSESPGDATVSALLTSTDRVIRAHAARGLGRSAAPDAPGRLVRVYDSETDVDVRRAAIEALAVRGGGAATLDLAAQLDPDGVVRAVARRALEHALPPAPPMVREVAWLRVVAAEDATLPSELTGALILSDGLAVPVAFDEDGFALIPGVPPGGARLRLAPRLPAYRGPSP